MASDQVPITNDPDSLHAIANERLLQARFDEAADFFQEVLLHQPECAGAWNNLGLALLHLGRTDAAERCFRQTVSLQPDLAEAYNNLGFVLVQMGRPEEAVDRLRRAVALQPDLAEAHNNLGLALWHLGRHDEAIDSFRRALTLQPNLADAWNNLGTVLAAHSRHDEALSCYERAVELEAGHVGAVVNLGNAYKDQGRLDEAVTCYQSVLSGAVDRPAIHSNLLLALLYKDRADPMEILAEARRFAERYATPLARPDASVRPRPPGANRLRVGYVSADFREHPVACFLEPILNAHDHDRLEVFCYSDVACPDEVTGRCRRLVDQWHSLAGLSDAEAADLIRGDAIDVLVDLAGHTGGNRLLTFARNPAPVQASYLGYLGTTGLAAMDYYMTDAHADPPGLAEAYYQEQLIRLPWCAFCYAPGPAPVYNPEPPALRSGRVTFGCLNNLAKITDDVLEVWSRLLAFVPGSQLRLPAGAGRAGVARVREALARRGIAAERMVFAGCTATRFEYLALYDDIDIALDPFPYNGVTTTCDALWMGVPVISLAGRVGASRQGVRFLRTLELNDLLADTPEDYVRIAATLAGDLPRLGALHCDLRERMGRSPLMDARRLTRDLEAAYHEMHERAPVRGRRIKPPDRPA
jgi:predicted O-linked N-acetylglucosamine transferase (SPINDLY family)